jgi:ketosteroid isomerase-like protein
MAHPNEDRLADLYARFAVGDIAGFLDGCTDDITFTVPGDAAVSGKFDKATFDQMIAPVMERSAGTFQEDIEHLCANDDRGVLLLLHTFTRDGQPRSYRTAHLVEFRDGRLSRWEEHPGSLAEFEAAWGRA